MMVMIFINFLLKSPPSELASFGESFFAISQHIWRTNLIQNCPSLGGIPCPRRRPPLPKLTLMALALALTELLVLLVAAYRNYLAPFVILVDLLYLPLVVYIHLMSEQLINTEIDQLQLLTTATNNSSGGI